MPAPPPSRIFIIRHGDKPITENGVTYNGIDVTGATNPDCLIPRGWQRAGGLATLFDTAVGTMRPDLAVPTKLYTPQYKTAAKTVNHRTYETVLPLSLRLNLTIDTSYPEGKEEDLVQQSILQQTGVVLVAWEHDHIPDIAAYVPVDGGVTVPTAWPDDRFDVIWAFTLSSNSLYTFEQLPELLLAGDGPA
jgi:hypothetical protein